MGDSAQNILLTSDGGYVMAGYNSSTDGDATTVHGGSDCWIIKVSAAGTIQWQKSYGGTNTDYVFGLQSTPDGGYMFLGRRILQTEM